MAQVVPGAESTLCVSTDIQCCAEDVGSQGARIKRLSRRKRNDPQKEGQEVDGD